MLDNQYDNIYGNGEKSYKIIEKKGDFNHKFGGNSWILPICKNCNKEIHQIVTLDLRDSRLSKILGVVDKEIPLISCLNCSSSWNNQSFKINFDNKKIDIINIEDDMHEILDVEDRLPVPLEEVLIDLKELNKNELPTDEDSFYEIIDNFGSDYFCRILGNPLWLEQPLKDTCPICREKMIYIAMIGSQIYEDEPIIGKTEFFIGENILYFSFCKNCNLLYVESQSN